MTNDNINGVAILLDDIQGELNKKRLSAKDRVILKSLEYIMKSLPPIREDVSNLKSTSWGYKSWVEPKKAFTILFVVYSFAISDIRQPVFAWLSGVVKMVMSVF